MQVLNLRIDRSGTSPSPVHLKGACFWLELTKVIHLPTKWNRRDSCCCQVAPVVSDSVRPHRQKPTRLLCPWDSPGKNTGVGCHFLFQCMKEEIEVSVHHGFLQIYWCLPDKNGFKEMPEWSKLLKLVWAAVLPNKSRTIFKYVPNFWHFLVN